MGKLSERWSIIINRYEVWIGIWNIEKDTEDVSEGLDELIWLEFIKIMLKEIFWFIEGKEGKELTDWWLRKV